MKRRYGKSLLAGDGAEREGVNPMDGVANLADVMLVFACGLMLALVINWNVDIAAIPEAEARGEEMAEVEDVRGGAGTELDADTRYEELGKVYRDPATGKLYLVTEDETFDETPD
ncbi:MAG: DUF2149 domain-containing protein [Clostridiales Family XIII bacterium]|jgi:hypothetical protein|nr:DUF2149 domain-containing protein [Clostridiales Family XIII bacterium]